MRAFGLEDMLAPVGAEDFSCNFFEKEPLFISRSEPAYHDKLFSLTEIDLFHRACRPQYTKVFAIDSRRRIATEEYADANGEVDALRLFQLFETGSTIVYREIESHFPPLAALCRSAEKALHSPFVANVYWTPAGGRCFPIHYDAKDVFALQLSGSKRWRVYRPRNELPLRHQHCYDALPGDGLLAEFELRAGDMLYCPRGFPHLVAAAEEASLHISLSTFPYTWADVINRAMADLFDRDPSFRASLPPGSLMKRRDALNETFAALINSCAERANLDSALDLIARELIASRPACTDNARQRARQANALSLDSWIESDRDALYAIEERPEAICLLGCGKEIEFHPDALAALIFALQTSRYQIRQMPSALEEDAKLDLARTLVLHGFVTVAINGSEPTPTLADCDP